MSLPHRSPCPPCKTENTSMPIFRKTSSDTEGKFSLRGVLTGVFILGFTFVVFLLLKSMVVHHFFSGGH
jgi:hypothetical protein